MQNMKKWLSIALVLVLTVALSAQAFALTFTWDMLKDGFDYNGKHYNGNAVLFDEDAYTKEYVKKAVDAFQRYWDASSSEAPAIYNNEFKPAILSKMAFKPHTFTDAPSAWYDEALNFVCSTGQMNGVDEGKFDPQGELNRAMAVTILWRMNGSPAPKAAAGFADVAADAWYAESVAWAVEQKITDGTTDTTFSPTDSVTREQMASFFSRMVFALMGINPTAKNPAAIRADLAKYYNDVDLIHDYALAHVKVCYEYEIMQGSGDHIFDPLSSITRAQGAQMLMNYYYMLLKGTFVQM